MMITDLLGCLRLSGEKFDILFSPWRKGFERQRRFTMEFKMPHVIYLNIIT